ncbi:protein CLEC16A homolog isoform X2 [Rhagoletis pomonella]|uniref:protein CLEC16A homolog isoform X2 n=1 Tax=Rhagoletis pomonella TaxID=28610 RepID=UPI00177C1C34|nr:protein CLEC16A homolog isoform X2 [Rhagoletis pomonella]
MFRSRSWFGGNWNRPKNRLSLEHLKYLYSILEKNTTVSESNRGLLVESLRCIAEILIWGDQHDSSVFDFFLEKNMLSYFLHIMRQKSGGSSFVCVQLLQTLNILFENIRNETSLYYLLSNNHVNSIIVHKFDFSDEDVMGYYILFLKTLSLKLNTHTIHFFYNEHTNDFPLYTEAIKFFNHPESMVRIAVRTISLNVYKVQNASMLRFIRDKTAAPYFSNLVWFIGKHILELDTCVRTDIDHQSNQKLSNLVAEHLDHLHYLNDILLLEIDDLNAVLTEHLLHKLFVPLYIFSLTPAPPPPSLAVATQNLAAVLNRPVDIDIQEITNPRVSSIVALYLLSLVFLVVTHSPLVHALAWVILNGDHSVFKEGAAEVLNAYVEHRLAVVPGFGEPRESLEQALETVGANSYSYSYEGDDLNTVEATAGTSTTAAAAENVGESIVTTTTTDADEQRAESDAQVIKRKFSAGKSSVAAQIVLNNAKLANITDEEKEKLQKLGQSSQGFSELSRPFLQMVLSALDCTENDYLALLALCLTYAMAYNRDGVKNDWFEQVLSKSAKGSYSYKTELIERLLHIISLSSQPSCRIRLITIEIALQLLVTFTKPCTDDACITEAQQDALFLARNQSMVVLRNFYKSEDIFLDLFEDEFNEMRKAILNVEFLCMDSTILLPPTGTPLTGINFTRRLPCGEVEKARRAIRVFFLLRRTCQQFLNEKETLLPLTNTLHLVQVDNVLDLNNSDLIACTVISKDSTKQRRFLVIDSLQLILVEPDAKLLGWGVAKFVGFLQDVEVVGDKDDSRCLHITVHRGGATHNRTPLLSAKFLFDDHIRCMAAKQRLTKGRSKARQKKMYQIAQLIEMPGQVVDSPVYAVAGLRAGSVASSSSRSSREHRPILSTANRVPGFAAALKRDTNNGGGVSRIQMARNRSIEGIRNESVGRPRRRNSNSSSHSSTSQTREVNSSPGREHSPSSSSQSREHSQNRTSTRSRDSSPRMPRPRSEEIPLEDFQHSRNNSPQSRGSSSYVNTPTRVPTPSRALNYEQIAISVHNGMPRETHSPAPLNPTQLNGVAIAKEVVVPVASSEETSFIGSEDAPSSEQRRRGIIETV